MNDTKSYKTQECVGWDGYEPSPSTFEVDRDEQQIETN